MAFHTGVGAPTSPPSAFHYHGTPPRIPVNQIGSGAAGATTSFNKTDVTGGVFSIGTPLHPTGKFRRAGKKRGF
jgi:hypothetical protein